MNSDQEFEMLLKRFEEASERLLAVLLPGPADRPWDAWARECMMIARERHGLHGRLVELIT